MRHLRHIVYLLACLLTACTARTPQPTAAERLQEVRQWIDAHNYYQARAAIDSVHILFPRQVEVRREAKHLSDSISYLEAVRTEQYSDSLLHILQLQCEQQQAAFRFEQSAYEDAGHYVHPRLLTSANIGRNFLQVYLAESGLVYLRSYYYGSAARHQRIAISTADYQVVADGENHTFVTDGQTCELLTIDDEQAMPLLQMIAGAAPSETLRLTLFGERENTYTLARADREALTSSLQLAVLLRDKARVTEELQQVQRQRAYFWARIEEEL